MTMDDKEDRGASLSPYQIVDFILAPASTQSAPSRTSSHQPTPLHCRIGQWE